MILVYPKKTDLTSYQANNTSIQGKVVVGLYFFGGHSLSTSMAVTDCCGRSLTIYKYGSHYPQVWQSQTVIQYTLTIHKYGCHRLQ